MAIDVIMPQMGESIAEGTLTSWKKQVGEQVKKDEPLFEISTDKVDAEIPAPETGVLTEILVSANQTVPVNTVVARIEKAGSAAAPAGAGAAKPKAAAFAPAPATSAHATATASSAAAASATTGASAAKAAPTAATAPAPISAATMATLPIEEVRRRRSSPLVRKIAKENGVTDLSPIRGTGQSGRITKNDIQAWLASGRPGLASAPAVKAGAAATTGAFASSDGIDLTPFYPVPGPQDRIEPMNNVRKRTVAHMAASKRISAHVTSFFECDMTLIANLRDKKKQAFAAANGGVNLSFTSFFLKATVDALGRWPALNCSVSADRNSIIHHPSVNLGIAVALDWGLIVPVIHNAQHLNLAGLATRMTDLATRARAKQLKPEEIGGGTFTITNPGVFGSLYGTPIIPQPQVAILGIGAIKKRPMVIEVDGQDAIAVRHMCNLSISFDHRVIDGAIADQFVSDIVAVLEDFQESWV